MGSAGIGAAFQKSNSKKKETIQRDPISEAIAKLLYSNVGDAASSVGGLSGLLNNVLGSARLSPGTQDILGLGADFAREPGLSLDDYYTRSLQSLNPDFYLNNANQYLSRVLGPEIQGDYSLLGLGRSGAGTEARAKAASGLSLPISQQYLQNLNDLNRSLPGTDINLRNARLGRLETGAELSDFERQAGLDAYQRALQGLLTSFTSTPYTAAPTTTTKGRNLTYGANANATAGFGLPTG